MRIFYDTIAADYAIYRGVHRNLLRRLVEYCDAMPSPRVLEVGCGTGNYVASLAAATSAPCCGLEPSPKMLEAARKKSAAVSWFQGSGYELSDSASFERKTFSCLHLISEDAYDQGLARLKLDLQAGPIRCVSRYVVYCGRKPKACQKVAGGPSAAQTPGSPRQESRSTPEGSQSAGHTLQSPPPSERTPRGAPPEAASNPPRPALRLSRQHPRMRSMKWTFPARPCRTCCSTLRSGCASLSLQ
jgi:Methyltransferase domain